MHDKLTWLASQIKPQRDTLSKHSLYTRIRSEEQLRTFLEHHIYAVWDFMSLLKALQQQLTCTSSPWTPTPNPGTRRFINEIVLGEESDELPDGTFTSHFELYLKAMNEAGADATLINRFIDAIIKTQSYEQATAQVKLPEAVQPFVDFSFEVVATGKAHIIAAVFAFGREDVIPDMFTQLLSDLKQAFPQKYKTLVYYFDRHIELDGDEHGPMSLRMIAELCGEDEQKWLDVAHYAKLALNHRIQLWDRVLHAIEAPVNV